MPRKFITNWTNSYVMAAVCLALGTAPSLAEILVGLAAPVSGPIAAAGEQATRGARKAVDDINQAGGVNGEKLRLVVSDDACDPKQAVNVANQLADKGVRFVAGHLCSGASIPASKVYEEEDILMITPSSTSPKLTDGGGWNIARVCGRDDAQGDLAGKFLARLYAGRKVAIVDDKSAFGNGVASRARSAMNSSGLTEVLDESITAGEKDYTALVSKLKNAGVEAIYFGGYHPEAGQILRQMDEQGLKARMFAPDAVNTAELWSIAGPAASNLFFTFSPDPRYVPEAQTVVKSFRADGYDPEAYTLYTYAAFQLYRAAAEATGSTDSQKIAAWLRAGNPVQSVLGAITLDAKGDVVNPSYAWFTFKDGRAIEVPSSSITR